MRVLPLILLILHATTCVLYTFEDFTAYTIPSADKLNISSHFICFGGWTMVRYPSSIMIACNNTLSSVLWPNEPDSSLGTPTVQTDYPPPLLDTMGLWFFTDWFMFGSCDSNIIQCNASIPITNHTYADGTDDGVIVRSAPTATCHYGVITVNDAEFCAPPNVDFGTTDGCPTNIVNYYNVCSNVAFYVMTYPMDQFEKSVWNRDQLIDFMYEHCNTTEVALELGEFVKEERSHVDVDFSWVVERVDTIFLLFLVVSFCVGCALSMWCVALGYCLLRKKKFERADRPAFEDDENAIILK